MTDQVNTMFANLETKTGHDRAFWLKAVADCGLEKHGQIIAYLKSEFGIGHGYANTIVHIARETSSFGADADDLIEAQYKGKEHLWLIYAAVAQMIADIGDDYEIAPKKAGVSFRRKKQFVLVEPKTKTRVDIGINLKGHEGTDRLKAVGGMCTHKVGITDVTQVDSELSDWIKQAYDAAG